MSFLNSLKGAISAVEKGLDRVLDIQVDEQQIAEAQRQRNRQLLLQRQRAQELEAIHRSRAQQSSVFQAGRGASPSPARSSVSASIPQPIATATATATTTSTTADLILDEPELSEKIELSNDDASGTPLIDLESDGSPRQQPQPQLQPQQQQQQQQLIDDTPPAPAPASEVVPKDDASSDRSDDEDDDNVPLATLRTSSEFSPPAPGSGRSSFAADGSYTPQLPMRRTDSHESVASMPLPAPASPSLVPSRNSFSSDQSRYPTAKSFALMANTGVSRSPSLPGLAAASSHSRQSSSVLNHAGSAQGGSPAIPGPRLAANGSFAPTPHNLSRSPTPRAVLLDAPVAAAVNESTPAQQPPQPIQSPPPAPVSSVPATVSTTVSTTVAATAAEQLFHPLDAVQSVSSTTTAAAVAPAPAVAAPDARMVELATQLRDTIEQQRRQIAERDVHISQLMQDGEQLTRKEQRTAALAKQLQDSKQAAERSAQAALKRMQDTQTQMSDMMTQLARTRESERRSQEASKTLRDRADAASKRAAIAENELRVARENIAAYQYAVDKANGQLEMQKREIEMGARNAGDQMQSVREHWERKYVESQAELEAERAKAKREIGMLRQTVVTTQERAAENEAKLMGQVAALQLQVRDLQASLSSSSNVASPKQGTLSDQQQQQQQQQNQRFTSTPRSAEDEGSPSPSPLPSNSESVAPLLRQIETWRSRHSDVLARLDALEESSAKKRAQLTSQLESTQNALAAAERLIKSLQHDHEQSTLQSTASHSAEVATFRATLAQLEGRIVDLEQRLAAAKNELDDSRAKSSRQQKDITDLSTRLAAANSAIAAAAATSAASKAVGHSSPNPSSITASPNQSTATATTATTSATASTGAGMVNGSPAAIRQLRLQISALQSQLSNVTRERDNLSAELVQAAIRLDQKYGGGLDSVKPQNSELDALRKEYAEALELLGEKSERVIELEADLQEVKATFRQQIQELM
ncbi:hypothetical protein GQ42DRAFT_165459, partial [Ramicandelaber brevisporus]